jgi:hypothetical protein
MQRQGPESHTPSPSRPGGAPADADSTSSRAVGRPSTGAGKAPRREQARTIVRKPSSSGRRATMPRPGGRRRCRQAGRGGASVAGPSASTCRRRQGARQQPRTIVRGFPLIGQARVVRPMPMRARAGLPMPRRRDGPAPSSSSRCRQAAPQHLGAVWPAPLAHRRGCGLPHRAGARRFRPMPRRRGALVRPADAETGAVVTVARRDVIRHRR